MTRKRAIALFKQHPEYSSVQVEIHDRSEELHDAATPATDAAKSEARADLYTRLYAIQARAYLRLVNDMEHQEAYEQILKDNVPEFWAGFAKTTRKAFTTTTFEAAADIAFLQGMRLLLEHWITEGHRRIAHHETLSVGSGSRPSESSGHPRFANRARWLKERLREREWSTNKPSQFGGPDHKTIKRLLDGQPVHDSTIDKLLLALNKVEQCGKLRPDNVPSD